VNTNTGVCTILRKHRVYVENLPLTAELSYYFGKTVCVDYTYYYMGTVSAKADGSFSFRFPGYSMQVKLNDVSASTVKDIRICLNGNDITTTKSRVFGYIRAGSSLSIADCTGDGTVYGGTGSYGQIVYTYAVATLNIFGGNFTSTNTATTGGLFAIGSDQCGDLNKDGSETDADRNMTAAKSVMNIYGGNIYGGKAESGGNIAVFHGCDLNMYGGTVSGGTATATNGGNIKSYTVGTITLSGGTISGGSAKTYGGSICMSNADGKLNLRGTTVTGGTATSYGGNIANSGTVNMYGGTVSDGTAGSYSGNIHNAKNLYIYGGTVSGGDAKGAGGNILTGTGSKFCIYGGTVENGTSAAQGGNIQILGDAYLCGGTFRGGSANQGGNVAVLNKGYMKSMVSASTREPLAVENGTATAEGSSIYVSSTALLENGTFTGPVYIAGGGKLTVSKNVAVSEVYVAQGGTCNAATLTEGAAVVLSVEDITAAIGTGTTSDIQYLTSKDAAYVVTCKDGTLYLATPVAETDGKSYGSIADAIAYTTSYVKLTADTAENVELSGDVYLDLNGKVLTGNITGEGTLYGMDSATDDYTAGGRITGTVSCKVESQFKTDITGKVRRYMAVSDETGYTFNRFYIGITHLNLKPGTDGVGYKATVAGNDAVLGQIKSYGYKLWITQEQVAVASKNGAPTDNMTTVTARVQNFDVANYGEVPVYGSVFMELQDGTVIESTATSFTLRNMLETISANTEGYSETQLSAVKAMAARFADAMANWNIDALK